MQDTVESSAVTMCAVVGMYPDDWCNPQNLALTMHCAVMYLECCSYNMCSEGHIPSWLKQSPKYWVCHASCTSRSPRSPWREWCYGRQTAITTRVHITTLLVRSAKLCQKSRSSCPTGIWVSRPVGKGTWTPLASKRAGFVRLGLVTLISASPFLLDKKWNFWKYFRAQAGQFRGPGLELMLQQIP